MSKMTDFLKAKGLALDPRMLGTYAGVPLDQWPAAFRLIAGLRRPGDAGMGDTVARIVDWFDGGDLAKAYEEVTKMPCGCSDRRDWLNSTFPYPK